MNLLHIVLLILSGLVLIYILIPHMYKLIIRRRFISLARKSGKVYVTFDDGPSSLTTTILEILEKTDGKATFFLVGENIERHPDIVLEILKHGHEIGYHSDKHTYAFTTGPIKTYLDIANIHSIRTLTGDEINLYRPPFGKLNIVSLLYAICSGLHLAYWDIDPRDYAAASAEAIIRHVLDHLEPGSVILLHDSPANIRENESSYTVEALENLILGIKERGLQLGVLGELYIN